MNWWVNLMIGRSVMLILSRRNWESVVILSGSRNVGFPYRVQCRSCGFEPVSALTRRVPLPEVLRLQLGPFHCSSKSVDA
jgi:hypothetical protein